MRMPRILGLLLAPALALGDAPSTSPAQGDPIATVPSGNVDAATGKRLAAAGAVVVDVRTPEEYAAGHVAGARNVPHDQIARRAAELGPPQTPVVLYCRSGHRSGIALGELRKLGFTKVWNAGGYDAWTKAQ